MRRFLWMASALVMLVLLSGLLLPAAEAQTATWTVQFFNNTTFTTPVLTIQDTSISENWAASSPQPGIVNTDNFSARYTATVPFVAGTYRFVVQADDGARLYLNNSATPLIDTFSAAGQQVAVDTTLATGNVIVRLDYIETTGNALVFLNWANAASLPTATATIVTTPTATPTTIPGVITGGTTTTNWSAAFYNNISLSGAPIFTTTVNSPSINWGSGSPAATLPVDGFSARFTATENLTSGIYHFDVSADDGVRVTVNNQRVIDHWYEQDGTSTHRANVQVFGATTVMIEYFETGGNALLRYTVSPAPAGTSPATSFAAFNPATSPGLSGSSAYNGTAWVRASRLNVREQPSATSPIIAKVSFGEYYSVIGTNGDQSWWQIRVANLVGWVSGQYVRISAVASVVPSGSTGVILNPYSPPAIVPAQTLPIVGLPPVSAGDISGFAVPPVDTGFALQATANLVLRSQASVRSTRTGLIAASAFATILGRNSSNSWWYVSDGVQRGWVSGSYVTFPAGFDANRVPVLVP